MCSDVIAVAIAPIVARGPRIKVAHRRREDSRTETCYRLLRGLQRSSGSLLLAESLPSVLLRDVMVGNVPCAKTSHTSL